MWNQPSSERLSLIPELYSSDHTPLQEKLIHLHFFIAGCDWYIVEYDGIDTMWGFAIINNDYQCAEWGYISLSELQSIKVAGFMEIDCELPEHWRIRPAIEVEKIRRAHRWWQYPQTPVSTRMETHTP